MKDRAGTVIEAGDTVVYSSRSGLVSGVVNMVIDRNKLRYIPSKVEPGKYTPVALTDGRVYVRVKDGNYNRGAIVRRSDNLQVIKKGVVV
jgi:hypothetical protein